MELKGNTLKLTEVFFLFSAMYNYHLKLRIVRTSAIEIRAIILNVSWHTPATLSTSKESAKDSPNSRMHLLTTHRGSFLSPLKSFQLANTRTGLRHSNS